MNEKQNAIPNDKKKLIYLFGKRTANAILMYQKYNKQRLDTKEKVDELIYFLRSKYSTPEHIIHEIMFFFEKKCKKRSNLNFHNYNLKKQRKNDRNLTNKEEIKSTDIPSNLFRTILKDFRKTI